MSAGPELPAGAVTVQEVPSALQDTPVAAAPSNVTPVEPGTMPAPVRVTVVPPAAVPDVGERLVRSGRYVKALALVPVCPSAVMLTVTAPGT